MIARLALIAATLSLALAACGGDDGGGGSDASTTAAKKAPRQHKVTVAYDEPQNDTAAQVKEILSVGGLDGISKGFAHSFKLPYDIGIHVVNGSVGPFYDPSNHTITVSYGFAGYVADLLVKNFPVLRTNQNELGKQWAAINDFILIHEWGHALIDAYDLPVLGKEEDAADALATVFMVKFVDGGAEYAFDAARFFDALSARQRRLAEDDYWDEHSLDKQRAYSIVCGIAGANENDYEVIRKAGILGDARLRSCPAEYQQRVQSWESLLKAHVRRSS